MPGIDEIVHVPEASADTFRRKIDFINRRAREQRWGIEISIDEAGRGKRPVSVTRKVWREGAYHQETSTEDRDCVLFRLQCPEPVLKLEGWAYAGMVAAKNARRDVGSGDIDAGGHWVLSDDGKVPQRVLDHAFAANGMMRCDHCDTLRSRKVGIVVANTAGDVRVVGTACARDYLGHDPKVLLSYFQHINLLRRDLEAERKSGFYTLVEYDRAAEEAARQEARRRREHAESQSYPLRRIVGATLEATLEFGGVRDRHHSDPCTEDRVAEILAEGGPMLDQDQWARVDAAIAWFRKARDHRWRRWEHDILDAADAGRDIVVREAKRTMWMQDIMTTWSHGCGQPLAGRFFENGDVLRVAFDRTMKLEDREARRAYHRHVFRAEDGSQVAWPTFDLAVAFRRGDSFHVRVDLKRPFLEAYGAVTLVKGIDPLPTDDEGRPLVGGEPAETVWEREAREAAEVKAKAERKARRLAAKEAREAMAPSDGTTVLAPR